VIEELESIGNGSFSTISDGSPDSNGDIEALLVRYIRIVGDGDTKRAEIVQRLIGFHCLRHSADGLVQAKFLTDRLAAVKLNLKQCSTMCFDGCSVNERADKILERDQAIDHLFHIECFSHLLSNAGKHIGLPREKLFFLYRADFHDETFSPSQATR